MFEVQYENVLRRLSEYRQNNLDNQNHIQINQLKNQLEEIEERRDERLKEILHQRSVYLKPLKRLTQLELVPASSKAMRGIPNDWLHVVKEYEAKAGRLNVRAFLTFGLVDFYSENYSGRPRYIILIKDPKVQLSKEYLQDLIEIKDSTYVYVLKNHEIVKEVPLSNLY